VDAIRRAVEEKWDAIILDRMLPNDVDGLSIVETLRSLGRKTSGEGTVPERRACRVPELGRCLRCSRARCRGTARWRRKHRGRQGALAVVRAQRNAGYASYLQLLSAEETYQTAVTSQVQAQTNRFADTAALFQALGGGWWNRSDARMGGLAADHSRKPNTD